MCLADSVVRCAKETEPMWMYMYDIYVITNLRAYQAESNMTNYFLLLSCPPTTDSLVRCAKEKESMGVGPRDQGESEGRATQQHSGEVQTHFQISKPSIILYSFSCGCPLILRQGFTIHGVLRSILDWTVFERFWIIVSLCALSQRCPVSWIWWFNSISHLKIRVPCT